VSFQLPDRNVDFVSAFYTGYVKNNLGIVNFYRVDKVLSLKPKKFCDPKLVDTYGVFMKKLVLISMLTCLSTNSFAATPMQYVDGAFASATTAGVGFETAALVGAAGGAAAISSGTMTAVVAAVAGGYMFMLSLSDGKVVAPLIKADIEEYNASGELSPFLNQIVVESQRINPELSTGDALDNLSNNIEQLAN